ncbi:hypothetical protein AB0H00_18730 [Nocardia sp. NPDC023852]|uniref:hypothetical protein n=1 Tax=unclassified Nocardia TaxID=2637762 RepID=UPI0033FA98D8|nr:hypothetical protein OH799_30425 [Nocardia sp. NBC_00881]
MIIIIGLVILIAAVIIGVAAVVGNMGEAQQLTSDFAAFDYHFHGSTGALFGYGIVLGAIGMLGLALVLTGAWRVTRRGAAARRELRQSRREMAAVRRDLASTPEVRQQTEPKATREPAWRRLFGKPATAPAGAAPRTAGARGVRASTSK